MLLSADRRELNFPWKNLKVSASMSLERKDLSGQGSGSAFASGGNKPQELAVSMLIPVEQKAKLSELLAFATAIDGKGDPVVYNIIDDLAAAMKINQVIFSGSFSAGEHETLRAFAVSFTLQEFKSVSERQEANRSPVIGEADVEGEVVIGSTDPAAVNAAIGEAVK